MTSSAQQQQHHQTKFRWTENLTCRFIQLRKEHGKMFTGRKYSAQAGWEYILRQMREEFPTIMADVHYRVLKKKWSNLLQQYKELKNPVHGDKNKADDISWPFYSAIDEVVGNGVAPLSRRRDGSAVDEDEDDEDDLNPQEFLYVSVTPDNEEDEEAAVNQLQLDYNGDEDDRVAGLPGLQPLGREHSQGNVFDSETVARTNRRQTPTRKRTGGPIDNSSASLLSRLPPATELTIRPVRRNEADVPALEPIHVSVNGARNLDILRDLEERRVAAAAAATAEDERPRKRERRSEERESRLERRIVEFMEYTKRRDEENRNIMMRMLQAIEDIRNAVG